MHMMRTTGSTAQKLTYQDYLRFPDDGNRHELIDGAHYVTPAPALRHQQIVGDLYFHLRTHIQQHGGGQLFLSPLAVVFTLFDVVEPDLLYVSDARKHILTDKHVQGASDLVIEVISPTTRRRDRGVKLNLYDRKDVAEYWLVDPASNTIRVYQRAKGRLAIVADVSRDDGDSLRSPLFPELSLPLDRVFGK